MGAFVRSIDDLIDPDDAGVHYNRNVYRQLAERVEALVREHYQPGTNNMLTPTASPALATAAPLAAAPASTATAGARQTRHYVEQGMGNIIEIDDTAKIKVPVRVHGNHNRLFIGRNVQVDGTILEIIGNNCSVVLNDGVIWRGIIRCRHDNSHIVMGRKTTSMHAIATLHEAGRITIGEDCMFSGDVRFDVSDMHSIMDRATGERINKAQDITIGDHVWLGHGVMVLKGSQIGSGSVVGAKSLVGGVVPENVVVAGVPAKIIRENVEWSRKRL